MDKKTLLHDLILKLQEKDLEENQKHIVFGKLYKILHPQLYGYCISRCRSSPFTNDFDEIQELLQEARIKIYYSIDRFPISEKDSANKTYTRFIAWALFISKRKWLDRIRYLKNLRKKVERVTEKNDWKYGYNPFEEKEPVKGIKKFMAILAGLPEMNREVVLTYAKFRGGNVPEYILDALLKKYNKTKANLRQINKRTKNKIKKLMNLT